MSKRYINYEEPIFEQRAHRNAVMPRRYNAEELVDIICSPLLGALLRIVLFFIYLIPVMILCESVIDEHHILGIILTIIFSYYTAIGVFRWIDNRITSWRIDYYLHRRDFAKIWSTPSLYNYVRSYYRDEFEFTERGALPEYDVMYLNGFPENDIPVRTFRRKSSILVHELFHMTGRFFMGFLWKDDIHDEYFSETIYEVLWNIVYLVTLLAIIYFETYCVFFNDALSNGFKIFLGCYMVVQISAIGLRLSNKTSIYSKYKKASGENKVDEITAYENKDKTFFEFFSKHRFWTGKPTMKYSIKENELGISFRSFGLTAHTRYLLNVIKIFTLY